MKDARLDERTESISIYLSRTIIRIVSSFV